MRRRVLAPEGEHETTFVGTVLAALAAGMLAGAGCVMDDASGDEATSMEQQPVNSFGIEHRAS